MARAETITAYRVPDWLPDDTEESIVGTEWHQEAIGALAMMLREVADRRGLNWGVCEQIELGGLLRTDGTSYSPRPDVMVLAQPLAGHRSSISLAEAGTPLFIAEMASSSTRRNDLEGKKEVYAAIGVREYLIFDSVGNVLPTSVIAWRLASPTATVYTSWEPAADGAWHSSVFDLAFLPLPPFLRVRDRDGTLLETPLGAFQHARRLEQELLAERAARQAIVEQLRRLQGGRTEGDAETDSDGYAR